MCAGFPPVSVPRGRSSRNALTDSLKRQTRGDWQTARQHVRATGKENTDSDSTHNDWRLLSHSAPHKSTQQKVSTLSLSTALLYRLSNHRQPSVSGPEMELGGFLWPMTHDPHDTRTLHYFIQHMGLGGGVVWWYYRQPSSRSWQQNVIDKKSSLQLYMIKSLIEWVRSFLMSANWAKNSNMNAINC